MARFLFLIDDFAGHLFATVGLAQRAHEAGHQVLFVSSAAAIEKVRNKGVPVLAEDRFILSRNIVMSWGELRRRNSNRSRRVDHFLEIRGIVRSLVDRFRPDLVLFDPFLLHLFPFFWEVNANCASVSTKPLLTQDPQVPPYTFRYCPKTTRTSRAAILALWWLQKLKFSGDCLRDKFEELAIGVSSRSNINVTSAIANFPLSTMWKSRPVRFDKAFWSMPEIVLQAKEFDFPRVNSVPDAYFIGPCVAHDDDEADVPLKYPEGTGPLVYCSLGTVRRGETHRMIDFYRKVIRGVGVKGGYRLLVATGSREEATKLASEFEGYGNIVILGWASQRQVLTDASILITHGGGTSIKEAISKCVPMVVFPRRADQPGCASRVVYHRLGTAHSFRTCTEKSIKAAVDNLILNSSFRDRVRTLNEAFAGYDAEDIPMRTLTRLVTTGAKQCHRHEDLLKQVASIPPHSLQL
ncbi:glycosyltransferase (plasmid) [Allorhizobium ampelinum S4]|uniref:Glycosyltransferase n=1 Tax=Allorhizobium ampelinum (strain ATCC BAA-846 / DSM 112012 / S4) TaxID=311402 RepID=B9K392_ALLAM|nr:glycosyltransferase [Allorhizobium ampelinum]ACM39340.1 glycosyltransferase [Allorhizobium ampelinum S4]